MAPLTLMHGGNLLITWAAQVDPKKIEIETYTYIYVISDVLTGLRYLNGVVGARLYKFDGYTI